MQAQAFQIVAYCGVPQHRHRIFVEPFVVKPAYYVIHQFLQFAGSRSGIFRSGKAPNHYQVCRVLGTKTQPDFQSAPSVCERNSETAPINEEWICTASFENEEIRR